MRASVGAALTGLEMPRRGAGSKAEQTLLREWAHACRTAAPTAAPRICPNGSVNTAMSYRMLVDR